MTHDTTFYIWCPACECAVYELNGQPCPNCSRCAFCGSKIKPGEPPCHHDKTSESTSKLINKYFVPNADVPREQRRAAIRKSLEGKLTTCTTFVSGLMIGLSTFIFGLSNEPKTVLTVLPRAIIFALILLGAGVLVKRKFRRIENQRLEKEFPSDF